MSLHLTICPLASIVLIFVIIINILDIYFAGTTVILLALNVLISIFFVWVANKTCFSYRWVSWIIVAYLAISIIGYIAIIMNPQMVAADPNLKKMVEDDKAARNEIRNIEKEKLF
jgi:hypothetical protein